MGNKKVIVETKDNKKHFFRVSEHSDGDFWIYSGQGWGEKKVGEAESLEDALAIIKSSVSGAIRNVDVD